MLWLDAAPLWLVGFCLTLILVGVEELGVRCRRAGATRRLRHADEPDIGGESVSSLVGAALGLLALIFGFTYAMAQERYDARRALVMSEARAVATSYMRYQAFNEPERARLSELMGHYSRMRSGAIDAQRDREKLTDLVARTEAMQSQIWDLVLTGLKRQPELIEPVMDSTNAMFETTATRRAIVDARIPASIELALIAFAVVSAFFTGYGLALDRRHRGAVAALFLLFTLVFLLVIDLDRSYSGPIRVSQAPMIQAADHIARLEAARLAADASPAQ